jgi:hypothetical protein
MPSAFAGRAVKHTRFCSHAQSAIRPGVCLLKNTSFRFEGPSRLAGEVLSLSSTDATEVLRGIFPGTGCELQKPRGGLATRRVPTSGRFAARFKDDKVGTVLDSAS